MSIPAPCPEARPIAAPRSPPSGSSCCAGSSIRSRSTEMTGNADQIAYWNGAVGERWAKFQPDMDRNLGDITKGLLRLANARPGERVLDIGCGAGETSLLLAKAVGAKGHVTGVDISAPMLAVARARKIENANFV